MKHTVSVWTLRAAALAALFGAWAYATGPGDASSVILPSITDVATELADLVGSRALWLAVRTTLLEVVSAAAIAGVLGIATGFLASRTQYRRQVVEPVLAWTFMVPMILFYPMIILWLGVGSGSKVGYGVATAFIPIAYNSLRAFGTVDERYLRVGVAFGAQARQIDRTIKFRAGLPLVRAGLRIGGALAFITVIVAEMLSSQAGLGYLLSHSAELFETERLYATIIVILVLAGLVQFAIGKCLKPRGE